MNEKSVTDELISITKELNAQISMIITVLEKIDRRLKELEKVTGIEERYE